VTPKNQIHTIIGRFSRSVTDCRHQRCAATHSAGGLTAPHTPLDEWSAPSAEPGSNGQTARAPLTNGQWRAPTADGNERSGPNQHWLAPAAALMLALAWAGCDDFNPPKDESPAASSDGGQTSASSDMTFDAGVTKAKSAIADAGDAGDAGSGSAKVTDKLKTDFVVARSNQKLIFIPNPEKREVTIVDPQSFSLEGVRHETRCGRRPTYIGVHPSTNAAIVIDSETDQISILRASRSTRNVTAVDSICRPSPDQGLCAVHGANAIAFAPLAKYAVIYYSPEYVNDGDPPGGYQEIVVIGLEKTDTMWARRVTVGLKPRKLFFGATSDKLYLLTDSGISAVDLKKLADKGNTAAETFDFGPGVDVSKLEIKLSEYGQYALAFKPNDSKVYLLDTETQVVRTLDMGTVLSWKPDASAPPVEEDAGSETIDGGADAATGDAAVDGGADAAVKDAGAPFPVLLPGDNAAIGDVAFASSPDTLVFALVALPKQLGVLRVPIPDGFSPDKVTSISTAYRNERNDTMVVGPESKDGSTIILLDRAGLAPRVTLLKANDKSTDLIKSVRLAGTVDTAAFAPQNSRLAFITHNLKNARAGAQVIGYSALSINPSFAKYQTTSASPGPVVFADEPKAMFLTVNDDANGIRQLHRVSYDGLFVNITTIDEKPRTLGVLNDLQQVFIEHEHDGGRITLYNWDNGQIVGSLTGYLLPDRVKE
jgi:hypothetical protein